MINKKIKQYNPSNSERDHFKEIVSVLSKPYSNNALRTIKLVNPEGFCKHTNCIFVPNAYCSLENGHIHHSQYDSTQYTLFSPGDEGGDFWDNTLNCCYENKELISFAQLTVGAIICEKVACDRFIIACGDNTHMRSLFWDVISIVLNSYSGVLRHGDLLVCGKPVDPTLERLRDMRLIIAPDMEEGLDINNKIVEQLCSENKAYADIMGKDGGKFLYTPGYTLVFYDDYPWKVVTKCANDFDMPIVLPFNTKACPPNENYAYELACKAGPAILRWLINGAQKAQKMNFDVPVPDCVYNAIQLYSKVNGIAAIMQESNKNDGSSEQQEP